MAIPIIGDIVKGVGDLVSEVIPDADKRDEIRFKFAELADHADQRAHEQLLGQIETNKAEAGHASVYVAGWRPFVGWVCGAALAYSTILAPLIEFLARSLFGWKGAMPVIDTALLQVVLMGMLGLTAARTVETVTGTARATLKQVPTGAPAAPIIEAASAQPPKKRGFKIKI